MGTLFDKKLFLGLGLGFVLGLGGAYASARIAHHIFNPAARADWVIKHLTRKLDLSAEQSSRLANMKRELVTRHDGVIKVRRDLHNELLVQIRSDHVDPILLNKRYDEKTVEMSDLRKVMILRLAEFHAGLNPVQREKFGTEVNRFFSKHDHDPWGP